MKAWKASLAIAMMVALVATTASARSQLSRFATTWDPGRPATSTLSRGDLPPDRAGTGSGSPVPAGAFLGVYSGFRLRTV